VFVNISSKYCNRYKHITSVFFVLTVLPAGRTQSNAPPQKALGSQSSTSTLHDGTVIGTVRQADRADSADSADREGSADSADREGSADSADSADRQTHSARHLIPHTDRSQPNTRTQQSAPQNQINKTAKPEYKLEIGNGYTTYQTALGPHQAAKNQTQLCYINRNTVYTTHTTIPQAGGWNNKPTM
jgi:hypothetical protein